MGVGGGGVASFREDDGFAVLLVERFEFCG